MGFPERLLVGDEDVVVELRPHWVYLGWPLVVGAAAAAGVVALAVAFPNEPGWLSTAQLVLLAVAALWLGVRILRWMAATLVITTLRLVQRNGVVARHMSEIRLDRVNELSFRQPVAGRLLGYGDLVVDTGGERGLVVFDLVRRPAVVQRIVNEQINGLGAGSAGSDGPVRWDHQPGPGSAPEPTPAGGTPSSTGPSLGERLVELDELRRRGILTDAEFAAKKTELLQRY